MKTESKGKEFGLSVIATLLVTMSAPESYSEPIGLLNNGGPMPLLDPGHHFEQFATGLPPDLVKAMKKHPILLARLRAAFFAKKGGFSQHRSNKKTETDIQDIQASPVA